MSSTTLRRDLAGSRVSGEQKVIVSWQHPDTRAIEPIGILSLDAGTYRFAYLDRTLSLDGFRPLLGLPDLRHKYEADVLFPLFAERAMDPKRPDFSRYVTDLALDDATSTPWEQIIRSGGAREGDTIQLFPVPRLIDGTWHCSFLVHGMRYMMLKSVVVDGSEKGKYDPSVFESLLTSLVSGSRLALVPEPDNPWTPLALLVTTEERMPLGYVPQLLLEALHADAAQDNIIVEVEKVNDSHAGWHLRMLVALSGTMDAEFDFFGSDEWTLANAS